MRTTRPISRRPLTALGALGALALALSGVLLTATPAAAASFVVSSTDDTGPGSLRQAIIDANTDAAADTITITATGTIALLSSLPQIIEPVTIIGPGVTDLTIDADGHDVFVVSAPIAVTISGLTITEAGTSTFVAAIDGAGEALTLSDLEVNGSWQGLSLTSGYVNATDVSFVSNIDSGAVLDLAGGASTFDNVTMNGNGATGNSSFFLYLWNDASLTAMNTTVGDNETGGMNIYAADSSIVTFTNTQVSRNGLVNGGDGIYAEFFDDAQGSFTGTIVNDNDSDGISAELDNRTIVTFTDTTTNDNGSDGVEGSALKHARLTLSRTTAEGNGADGIDVDARTGADVIITTASAGGNGDNGLEIVSRGDGGVNNDASTVTVDSVTSFNNGELGADVHASQGGLVTITASAFVSNYSRGILIDSDTENGSDSEVRVAETNVIGNGQGTSNGGGIAIVRTTDLSVVVVNTTIAHNTGNEGGGIYARIAGANPSALTIGNSTISNNTATIGGGMYLRSNSQAPISIHSSTIADNTTTGAAPSTSAVYLQGVDAMFRDSILAAGSASDIDVDGTATVAFYHSLIQTPSAATIPLVTAPTGANIVGLDPQLGPLGDNGGFTLTRLPAATSPVMDTGDPEWSEVSITLDQRGDARVSGGRIDIGAVEIQQGLAATGSADTTAGLIAGVAFAALGAALLGYRRVTSAPR